jgi:uncharacterized membrane protein YgcG
MQQEQSLIHTSRENVSDNALPILNILTDSPKLQPKEENENQGALKMANVGNQQRQVTQQPTDCINLNYYSKTSAINPPIKKKKRRRRCCRRAKQSDEERCDSCDTWFSCVDCEDNGCDSCGSCGSGGSGCSAGSVGGGGGSCGSGGS